MIYLLGNILRISISDREHIPIRRELEHLRSYLEIQSFRFENLFSYEIQIPVHLYEYSILKLTLQPLVENSIQHGFEGISHSIHLHYSGRETGLDCSHCPRQRQGNDRRPTGPAG